MTRKKQTVKIELEVELPENATLDELEELIDQAGQQAKRKALKEAKQREGEGEGEEERPEQRHCGGALESKGQADLTIRTIFGTVVLPRHRYRCGECGEFLYSWERTELGLDGERRLSRRLRKLACWCGISWPLERATSIIEELTGAYVSPKEIQLILEEIGREAEGVGVEEERVEAVWEGELGEALKLLEGLDLSRSSKEAEEALKRLVGYLKGNRTGIGCYRELQKEGYLVGTGVVEKGCDVVIVRRQKKQGMVWSRIGAHLVTVLRSLFLNGSWEELWGRAAAAPVPVSA